MEGLRYLLDTNVVSEPTKPIPNPKVMKRLRRHDGKWCIASPVWHELRYGYGRTRPGKRKRFLERFLETLEQTISIVSYSREAARWHADERVRLAAIGRTPPFVDGQIASIAASHGLTLITRNLDDYRHFSGLKVRDWST